MVKEVPGGVILLCPPYLSIIVSSLAVPPLGDFWGKAVRLLSSDFRLELRYATTTKPEKPTSLFPHVFRSLSLHKAFIEATSKNFHRK